MIDAAIQYLRVYIITYFECCTFYLTRMGRNGMNIIDIASAKYIIIIGIYIPNKAENS